ESAQDLMRVLGELAREGVPGLVFPYVNTDARDSSRYVVYLQQAGLGLPDEAYYREERYAEVRTADLLHVERMLGFLALDGAGEVAQRVFDLETRLAKGHWDTVTNRDPVKTYTLFDAAGLGGLTPGLDWRAYTEGIGAPQAFLDAVVVRQPTFLE